MAEDILPSPAAHQVLRAAMESSTKRHRTKMGTADLLYAVVTLPQPVDLTVTEVLDLAGIDVNAVVRQLEKHFRAHHGADIQPEQQGSEAYSEDTRKVLQRAEKLARSTGVSFIEPIHLLYGLASGDTKKVAAGILNENGGIDLLKDLCEEFSAAMATDQAAQERASIVTVPVSLSGVHAFVDGFDKLPASFRTDDLKRLRDELRGALS